MSNDIRSVRAEESLKVIQAEACRLAEEFQVTASAPSSTIPEQINAETAKLIISLAEKRSRLIDATQAASLLEELKHSGDHLLKTFAEDVSASLKLADIGSQEVTVGALRSEALRQLTVKERAFALAMDDIAWKAWNQACEELIALGVGQDLNSQSGDA